jgi:hypothetical protein
MLSSKVVTPVKTGVQCFCNHLKSLDSGFHRNDDSWAFLTFNEFVIIEKGMIYAPIYFIAFYGKLI